MPKLSKMRFLYENVVNANANSSEKEVSPNIVSVSCKNCPKIAHVVSQSCISLKGS